MTVYVDDMRRPYRGMLMCHMVADSIAELLAMADAIQVAHRHLQTPETRPHFDICRAKRTLAVKHGAVEITRRQAARIAPRRRAA